MRQWLIDYCKDVLSGEIIACQKHKQACQRFLDDIEREGMEDFPYIFDEEKAIRFLEWMTLFKHTKGVLAGKHIQPHDIQVFVFSNIYGWVHKDTGYRRFKKAYWQVGRKNAKSQSLGCVATYEAMALGEGMSEVYIGATKREQAKIVYKEAKAMLNGCPDLQGKFKEAYGEIVHLKTDSTIRALSKEDKKSGDGFNPQCAIIDEYHAHDTSEIYDVMDSGMVSRPQPLLMIITTAGTNLGGPCYRSEYDYVSRLLNPHEPIKNEEYFAMVNELDKDEKGKIIDDIKDESSWVKANPIAASYPEGIANIRSKLTEALDKQDKMDDFLTKNMNVWINGGINRYMRLDAWEACGVTKDKFPVLKGYECYTGIDLSSKIDLTSVSFEFPLGDEYYAVLSHSFMPEDTVAAKTKTDKVPYDQWVREGWITTTPGAVVDYRFILAYIKRMVEEKGWIPKENCYDPYNATQFAQEMESNGYEMIEIRQGVKTLSEPTKNFRELVMEGKIIHDSNPVLSWAIGNAVTKKDAQENIMLDKEKSTNRIDPIASLINAHVRGMFIDASTALNNRIMSKDYSL
ncbi:terminase large subunit [Brevibacillus laterosporus]|uniref:terminase large subunit n=1 Tax=Brevibacillus laterosporus TaxID=1465 RepID=UPI003D209A6A